MKKTAILFAALMCSVIISAQEKYYSVIAKSGLSIREKPSLESRRVGILPFNSIVSEVERSGVKSRVGKGNDAKEGEWVLVENPDEYGWVFDAFLLPKTLGYNNEYRHCEEMVPCDALVEMVDFEMTIYNYQIIDKTEREKNRIKVSEFPLNELCDKLVEFNVAKHVDSISVSYAWSEYIHEQYDPSVSASIEFEDWAEEAVSWTGMGKFQPLPKQDKYYRMPITPYEEMETQREKLFGLQDTLVIIAEDDYQYATLMYKGKPCYYELDRMILKVTTYVDGKPRDRFVEIRLSYGC